MFLLKECPFVRFRMEWKKKEKERKKKEKERKLYILLLYEKLFFSSIIPSLSRRAKKVTFLWLTNFFLSPPPLVVADTLSLGDRTMDNMDRHGGQGRPRNQMLDPPNMKLKVEPTFDYSQNTNVTALIGKTAYLTCRVRNLGDKSVRFLHFHRPFFRVRISSARPSSLSPTFISYSCFRVGIRDIAPGKLFKTG